MASKHGLAMRVVLHGSTRVVFLMGPYAIKFAKFRFFYCLRRTCQIIFWRRVKEKRELWERAYGGVFRTIVTAFFAGIDANRREYRLNVFARQYALVPTVGTVFYVINIQRRGSDASAETWVGGHPLMQAMIARADLDHDLSPEQFCFFENRLCLADYGTLIIERIIEDTSTSARSGRAFVNGPNAQRSD